MPIDDDEDTEYGCATCDYRSTNEDDFILAGDDLLCESCRSWCNYCEEYCHNENTHYVEGIGDYCESCWENHTHYCERCSCTYSENESMYNIEDRGEYWCEGCFESDGFYCEECDQYYARGCTNCGEGGRGSRLINDYSYKPDPKFIGKDKNNLYFGIELEMEIRSGELDNSAKYVAENIGEWVYMKQDSSINQGGYRGFELVSHPISFSSWSDFPLFDKTLDYLREHQEARAWDAKSCGLHIHVSRAGFKSGAHTHRWLTLIYKNAPEMMKFAGRKSDYAKFSDVYKYDEYDRPYFTLADKVASPRQVSTERYSAVNTQNEHTLELRFFRGTTKPSGVRSAIQLAHASIEYTRDLTLSDVKIGALSWEWFYDYVEANNGFYPDLYERMSKVRSLSVDSKELVNA